jgi:hypothetical protein
METVACLRGKCHLILDAESNSELTVIVPAYQLHFRFPVQNKIHKQKILSDTRTGILGSIAGPCDFLPARSDKFQKVCPPFKMAAFTKNRNFFNCPLLLYYQPN